MPKIINITQMNTAIWAEFERDFMKNSQTFLHVKHDKMISESHMFV